MEFVYANTDARVLWSGGGAVDLRRDQIWWADDPFVTERPDLFSATPLTVHGTTGRQSPEPTALTVRRARKAQGRG